MYVCLCYVLVLVISGGWYSSCNNTRSLFTQQLLQYAASACTPHVEVCHVCVSLLCFSC